MNQILKDCVYGKGTTKQIEYIAEIGGMNDQELQLFKHIHNGKSDSYIMDEMCVSRSTFYKLEESMRTKVVIGIFMCIQDSMNKK